MSRFLLKHRLVLFALGILLASANVSSAQAIRRADSKIKGDFGTNVRARNYSAGTYAGNRYRYNYAAPAPTVVRAAPSAAAPAPAAVAQAPAARRAFSYAPDAPAAPQVSSAPAVTSAPTGTYYYSSPRRSGVRGNPHYPSYMRADSKIKGHFGT